MLFCALDCQVLEADCRHLQRPKQRKNLLQLRFGGVCFPRWTFAFSLFAPFSLACCPSLSPFLSSVSLACESVRLPLLFLSFALVLFCCDCFPLSLASCELPKQRTATTFFIPSERFLRRWWTHRRSRVCARCVLHPARFRFQKRVVLLFKQC